MGNKFLLILAILILGGLLVFVCLLLRSANDDYGIGMKTIISEESNEEDILIHDTISDSELVGVKRILPNERHKDRETTAAFTDDQTSTRIKLTGTIIAIDDNGIQYAKEKGHFYFVLWKNGSGLYHYVNVTEGLWSTIIPPDVEIGVRDIILGDRIAILENNERYSIPADGFLTIRVKWPPVPILHVIASDTGKDLDSVELVSVSRQCFGKHPKKCKVKEVFRSASSPIDMGKAIKNFDDLSFGKKTYFVRSPGYAWKRVNIDYFRGRDYFLKLYPCGDLEISITGYKQGTNPNLMILKTDEDVALYTCTISNNCTITIEDISVGVYNVSVKIGDFEYIILDEGNVTVLANQISYLALNLALPPVEAKVPLKGTLVVPTELNSDKITLRIEYLGIQINGTSKVITFANYTTTPVFIQGVEYMRYRRLVPRSDMDNVYSWDAGYVQPGIYGVGVKPFGYETSLRVDQGGLTNALISIPSFAHVSIRVVDEETGKDVEINGLNWHCLNKLKHLPFEYQSVKMNKVTGLYEFKAPIGKIAIIIIGDDYRLSGSDEYIMHINPGYNSCTIKAVKCFGLVLVLKDGDITLPIPSLWDISFKLVGDEMVDEVCSWWSSNPPHEERRFIVDLPGLYRFNIPDIDGYHSIPEQEVLVKPGEFTKHVIYLRRVK